jgi:hypothetical protein
MLHLEIFTNADVTQFAGSPWEEDDCRIEDTTEDVTCDLSVINTWLVNNGAAGIDTVVISEVIPDMRELAVRFRSEWSLTDRNQLSHEIVAGQPARRIATAQAVSLHDFEVNIQPLCFHSEMQATADADVIGSFLNDPLVWHLHPLEFMRWMNQRVTRHEEILASQDKRTSVRSTVVVENGYVRRFVNPVTTAAPAAGYPEVAWNDNSYEVTVNALCDATDLAAANQQTTCFHSRLLDALDMINDRPHGLRVVLSYVSDQAHAGSVDAARHEDGHAVDLRPGSGVAVTDWFKFFGSVRQLIDYMQRRDGASSIAVEMFQDAAPPARPQIQSTGNSAEWLRRLRVAATVADASLTAVDPAFPNLTAELSQMRIHLYIP